jgi:prephenate dehydratase
MAAASNRKRSAKEYRCSVCNKVFDSEETLNLTRFLIVKRH